MFEKCDSCTAPSKGCILKVMFMPAHDQREWCKMWKHRLGWTKKQMAERSGIPEGTIAGIFGKNETREAKTFTMRAIICALVGCTVEELCDCVSESEQALVKEYTLENERLSCECSQHIAEVQRLEGICAGQAERIRELEETVKQQETEKKIADGKLELAAKLEKAQDASITRLVKVAGHRRIGIVSLSLALAAVLVVNFIYLMKDINAPDFGFFRGEYFLPGAIAVIAVILAGTIFLIAFSIQMIREWKHKDRCD